MRENNDGRESGYNPDWFKDLYSKIAVAIISQFVKSKSKPERNQSRLYDVMPNSWAAEAQRRADDSTLTDDELLENRGDSINLRAYEIRKEAQRILITEKIAEIKTLIKEGAEVAHTIGWYNTRAISGENHTTEWIETLDNTLVQGKHLLYQIKMYCMYNQLHDLAFSFQVDPDSEEGREYIKTINKLAEVGDVLQNNIGANGRFYTFNSIENT